MSFSRGEWPASWRQVPRHAHSFIPRLMDQFRHQNAGQSASRSAAEVAVGPVGLQGGLQPSAASAVRGFQSPRGTARAEAPRHGLRKETANRHSWRGKRARPDARPPNRLVAATWAGYRASRSTASSGRSFSFAYGKPSFVCERGACHRP